MLTIFVVTVAITAVTTPLTYWTARTQLRMARIQPQLDELKRRHPDDRQRLAEETAALMRSHGVSRLSGCAPALLQAPLLVAMYRWVRHMAGSGSRLHFLGIDMAQTGIAAIHAGLGPAALFVVLVAVLVAAAAAHGWLAGRAAGRQAPKRGLLVVAQLVFAGWTLALPLAVTFYYAVSSGLRAGQFALVSRRLGA